MLHGNYSDMYAHYIWAQLGLEPLTVIWSRKQGATAVHHTIQLSR